MVTVADGPSNFKAWLREEIPADVLSDLRWLGEEYRDFPVILDLTCQENVEAASYKLMLDLRDLVEKSTTVLFHAGFLPQEQMRCVRLSDNFGIFASREAALRELAPQDAHRTRRFCGCHPADLAVGYKSDDHAAIGYFKKLEGMVGYGNR